MREAYRTVGRWAARGRGRSQSTASNGFSPFPLLGLAHRQPGFSRTRVVIPPSGWQLSGIPCRAWWLEHAACFESASRAGRKPHPIYRSVQWESAGLWSPRANKKKTVPGTSSHINSFDNEECLRKVLLSAPFYRWRRELMHI